jgi:hypothetical protein
MKMTTPPNHSLEPTLLALVVPRSLATRFPARPVLLAVFTFSINQIASGA